jgi:adenylate cyclase
MEGSAIVSAPDAYVLILAAFLQTWFASGWQRAGRARPMLANLIGPFVYMTLETLIEGPRFFEQANHLIYLGFGFGVGAIQWALHKGVGEWFRKVLFLAEGLSRGLVLLLMYASLEYRQHPDASTGFFHDPAHQYIGMALFGLGLLIGLLAYFEQRALTVLHDTAQRLRVFSEWSLGRDLTTRALHNDDALSLQSVELCILFVDIRGFTAWSEKHRPREVVAMLNAFYEVVETAVKPVEGIVKVKFTADEALVVCRSPNSTMKLAHALRKQLLPSLAEYQLSAGIGVHWGLTMQGLLGSESVKLFDVIGDTVNVAKRLCDVAEPGEILVSEACYLAAAQNTESPHQIPAGQYKTVTVKGKAQPLSVFAL